MEAGGLRHEALNGFEKTNILAFGGSLVAVKARPDANVLATYIPDFPIYPPETSWMREPSTDRPCVVARRFPQGGRCLYFAADIDRSYASWGLPDHAQLLANGIRWAAGSSLPLRVDGPGVLDCNLYAQGSATILHIVNLTTSTAWPGAAREVIEVGPLTVRLRRRAAKCRSLVTGKAIAVGQNGEWAKAELPSVGYHDVLVFE